MMPLPEPKKTPRIVQLTFIDVPTRIPLPTELPRCPACKHEVKGLVATMASDSPESYGVTYSRDGIQRLVLSCPDCHVIVGVTMW